MMFVLEYTSATTLWKNFITHAISQTYAVIVLLLKLMIVNNVFLNVRIV